MFLLTEEWLRANYGSPTPQEVEQARNWLLKYGQNVPPEKLGKWSEFRHLAEYQVNTNEIVEIALAAVGASFASELEAHMFLNRMRVPLAKSYWDVCEKVKPKLILELGVGGDSAISTAHFLRWVEMLGGQLDSVDINPLSMTWFRYEKFREFWTFTQADSLKILSAAYDNNRRYDLVFIDASHSYAPTLAEIEFASRITDYILMDDAMFEGNENDAEQGGVKRAIAEWVASHPDWEKIDYWQGAVALIQKKK